MQEDRDAGRRNSNTAENDRTDQSTRRTFLKGAAGAGAALVGIGLSGSAAAAEQLVVDDYEESSQWSSGQNDLGNWTGAGGWQSQDVSGGTLTLEYQDNAWYKTKVYQDVSAYDRIAIEARGATGSEAQEVEFTLGDTTDTLANLSGQSLGDSFTTLTIPFSEVSFDATTQSTLTFNAPWGTSGTVELQEVRFETSGGSTAPKPEPAFDGLPDTTAVGEYVQVYSAYDPQTSSVMVVEWDFGDGSTSKKVAPYHAWDSAGTYEVTLTYTYSDDTTKSTSQTITVEDPAPVAQLETTYELVESDSSEFTATVEVQNPEVLDRDDVDRLEYADPDEFHMQVADSTGFTKVDDSIERLGYYEATSADPDLSLTFERTVAQQGGTEGLDEALYQYDQGVRPPIEIVSDDPEASVDQSFSVAGPGWISEEHETFYFGDAEPRRTTTAHGKFQLVVPSSVDPVNSPDTILRGISEYAEVYDVSPTDEVVTGVPNADGHVTTTGFEVDADNDIRTSWSIWVHEYTHDVAEFDFDFDDLRWMYEGYAQYMAILAPFELNHGPYGDTVFQEEFAVFKDHLAYGEPRAIDLKNADSYPDGENYHYGALVLGSIDRRVREATDGETLFDVIEQVHQADDDGEVTHDGFTSIIADVANDDVAADADDWIKNNETPSAWSAAEHESAFGYQV